MNYSLFFEVTKLKVQVWCVSCERQYGSFEDKILIKNLPCDAPEGKEKARMLFSIRAFKSDSQ
ncbi:MAG: hypothetical protein CVU39_26165 [Chloroflexi bacterium HGW-Chloroflexi-10]|nr:MAG: hypothetical protein CVU39_26165 [Chloroflexi bacterium HGW-Chloroflexi-10]